MTKKGQKQKVEKQEVAEKDTTTTPEVDDEEVNSGFGSYLRSSTGKFNFFYARLFKLLLRISRIAGQETLRLFVVVNSLVMFLTIAWPQMKTVFEAVQEFMADKFGSSELF